MSAYHDIFIVPVQSVESLIKDVAEACGATLKPSQGEVVDYSASVERAAVEVELGHDYVADCGIAFEKYDSVITVRDFDSDKEREGELAGKIFRYLADAGKYSLVLVFDLQRLIDSAGPRL